MQKLYLDTTNASLYIALIPVTEYENDSVGLWKCVRISAKNKWSYELVGSHWFKKSPRFNELDINAEFNNLPEFQRSIWN